MVSPVFVLPEIVNVLLDDRHVRFHRVEIGPDCP